MVKKWFYILVGAMFLCGCSLKQPTLKPSMQLEAKNASVGEMWLDGKCKTENGMLLEVGKYSGLAAYYDNETKVMVPLCTKADCEHEIWENNSETQCTAALLARDCSSLMCIYEGKLWYFKPGYDENNMNRSLLCRADLTGENVEELFEVEGLIGDGNVYLYQGSLFFGQHILNWNELDILEGLYEGFAKVDLETGDVTQFMPLTLVETPYYRVIGLSDGKVYCRVHPCEEYENGAVVSFDCETGKRESIEAQEGILATAVMNEDYLVYFNQIGEEEQFVVIELQTGAVYDTFSCERTYGECNVFEDEILLERYDTGFYRYDIATKKLTYWEQPDLAKQVWIFASFEDGYMCRTVDPKINVMDEYAFVSREALKNGGEPIVLTEDKMPIW